MTLAQIKSRAREQVADQYNVGYDDDALLCGYINEGYERFAGGRLLFETMLTVRMGRGSLTGLAGLVAACALTDEQGFDRPFDVRHGELLTARDGLYVLTWRGDPEPLAGDADVPALPEGTHGALADYGSWRLLSNGGAQGQARAQFFYARYELARAQWARTRDEQVGATRLRNKYT